MIDPYNLNLAPWPKDDFSLYGEVESTQLPKIQRFVGGFLHANWVRIPHVFHQDEANITRLEKLRKELNVKNPKQKLTILPFIVKALAAALADFPHFNASLDGDGNLVYKKYFHIGVAVDIPGGLLVPVLRDCDKRSIYEIAEEMTRLSEKARGKGLSSAEMSGGCMTISSLGHIGGTGFTPIIKAPEVAILGLTKAQWKQLVLGPEQLEYQYRIPLSLSYDHRIINGSDAARFCVRLSELLIEPEQFI